MSDHEDLFVEFAREAFSFLCEDYDYLLDATNSDTNPLGLSNYKATFRRVTSDGKWQSVALQTTPERGELYIDMAYGWPPSESPILSLSAWDLQEIESSEPKPSFAVKDAFGNREMMKQQYGELGTIVKDHGSRFFDFDQTLADDLRALHEMSWKERDRRQKDRKIEAALRISEWARAVTYLEGLGLDKTPEQRESLRLAREQMRSNT